MPLSTVLTTAGVEDILHGVIVRDPYRWLEDRTLPETQNWIEDQQIRCDDYFANCPDLDAIRGRVLEYLDVEVVDQPIKVGDRYFYRRRNRGQEQPCIYVRDGVAGAERLLVDPSGGSQFDFVGIYQISEDGSLLAYEVGHGGEDKRAICFVDVESARALPDRIESGYAKGLAFRSDNRGFYYCHEVSTETTEHRILLHLFHESVADQAIFHAARSRESSLVLTADKIHLGAIWIYQQGSDPVADFFIASRADPLLWRRVFAGRKLPFRPILKDGRFFAVSYDAPNGKVVELSEDGCEIRTIVPGQDTIIHHLVIAGTKIYVSCLHNLVPSIRIWDLWGSELGAVDVPCEGTVQLLSNQSEDNVLFYTYESFTQPLTIYEYTLDSKTSRLFHQRCLPSDQHPVSVKYVRYASSDATQIPMALVSMRDFDAARTGPVIMTGYGGFGIPMTPQFSVLVSILLELGVAFALPHIRGGGEFGKAWHEAAQGKNRQVSFDDFLRAAEWLCEKGFTSPQQFSIFGGSNAGLLVGVAMTQRPDLFRAVLCMAPLLDMVRYEHFDQHAKWRKEYGTAEDPEDFHILYRYSPYHRLDNEINYPAVMFVTGDKDDRCNPAHVRKMAALLQDRDAQKHVVLVDYSGQRGHSPMLPLSFRGEALARRIAFLSRELNLSIVPGGPNDTTCD